MPDKKVVSLHLIADHDFVHHIISPDCHCKPEQISKDVWKHQPTIKYRIYKFFDDGTFDMALPEENISFG